MRAVWQTKRLSDICATELGKTPSRANAAFWDKKRETTNVWLSIADLLKAEESVAVDSMKYLSDKGAAISKIVRKGTLLVSFKLTLGRLAFAGRDLYTNEAIAALNLFHESEPSKEFLFYFLHFFDWRKAAENDVKLKGMTLNKAKLKEIQVSFPPLVEQRRIVRILDETFNGIAIAKANAEKNLQNARTLIDSYREIAFSGRGDGWTKLRLGEVCELLNGFAFKSGDAVAQSQTQLVRMGNLYGSLLDLERRPVFYPDAFAKEFRRYLLHSGDLIMSLTGTTGKEDYGYAVKIPESERNLLMNQRIVKFDSIREQAIDRDYLLHYLRSRRFLHALYATANGTRQANLSSDTIKTLVVPVCLMSEQQKIVSNLDELAKYVQRLESICREKIVALSGLKKSLLQKAFAGTL